MRMVVVLPAPLGPRKPTISPLATWKLTWSTAWTGPKYFVTFSTSIIPPVLWLRQEGPDPTAGEEMTDAPSRHGATPGAHHGDGYLIMLLRSLPPASSAAT